MFQVLGEENIIDENLAEKLADMAKFRNILVHRYGDVENEELRTIIDEDLEDVRNYMSQIDRLFT